MQSAQRLSTVSEHAGSTYSYDHRKYLSDAGFEKTASSDESLAEEEDDHVDDGDDDDDHDDEAEGQSFIGISIGAEQTRLASPSTPAAEKAAAIGDDPFARALEQIERDRKSQDANPNERAPRAAASGPASPGTSLSPSLQRSDVKSSQQSEGSLSSALRSVMGARPRSSSGPLSGASDRNQRKLLPISLPSLPKISHAHRVSLPTVDTALSWLRPANFSEHHTAQSSNASSERSINRGPEDSQPRHAATSPNARILSSSNDPRSSNAYARDPQQGNPPPMLRRSTSDGSLYLARSLSRASSLGDDTRWQDVHEQVNSRMKAIKDSLADSNFKMPRFRPAWLDINFGPWAGETHPVGDKTTQTRDFGHSRNLSEAPIKQRRSVHADNLPVSPPGGMNKTNVATHPQFSRALKRLTGDVVILGGYRGSVLRSAEPPYRQQWVPIKVGLGVRKVNLEVGLEPEDDENMENTIIPSGMLKNIGPVDISRRLFKRLRSSKNSRNGILRVWDYGYDWRLSPHLLSRRLQEFLSSLPSNTNNSGQGAFVVAHSLGGLITRHAINARPDLFSGVIYAGVPQTCVNVLGPLRNGDAVLLSSRVLTAQVNFTIRTSFALLPLDGKCFIDRDTKEEYSVDFFDPNTWDEYHLSPCINRPLPSLHAAPEPQGAVSQLVETMANALPNVPFTKNSTSKRNSATGYPSTEDPSSTQLADSLKDVAHEEMPRPNVPVGPHMDQSHAQKSGRSDEKGISTAVTISKEDAVRYLTRTLSEVKKFKEELAYKPELEDKYPPAAVIYGKSTPTVYGAGVRGRDSIKRCDAYENLLFASGDGVVLARAAQIPTGYHVARGGVVSSERGHISLLGDLEAVGTCFNSILAEQKRRARRDSVTR